MSKCDVKLTYKPGKTLLRPISDAAFQTMATTFFEETWAWEGNVLVVSAEKSDAVIAILEEAGLVLK